MKLTELGEPVPVRKDPASNSGDCCALYRLSDGGRLVVGRKVEVDAALKWGVKDDEAAVYVPPGVLAEE